MPYITDSRRDDLEPRGDCPWTPGELNFQLSRICAIYIGGTMSYTKINEVIGVLECAKLELYRRIAAPYEDKKCQENGDVYGD